MGITRGTLNTLILSRYLLKTVNKNTILLNKHKSYYVEFCFIQNIKPLGGGLLSASF